MGEVVFLRPKDTALVEHKYHLWQYIGTLGPYPTEPNLLVHALKINLVKLLKQISGLISIVDDDSATQVY